MLAERLVWACTCASPKQLGCFLFSSGLELLLEQHKDCTGLCKALFVRIKSLVLFPPSSHSGLDLASFSAAYVRVSLQVLLHSGRMITGKLSYEIAHRAHLKTKNHNTNLLAENICALFQHMHHLTFIHTLPR